MNPGQAKLVFPGATEAWLLALIAEMPRWGIDTPNEEASFCAQISHESRGLTVFEENLNYSVSRLMQVWPRRFSDIAAALPYAHNPEALAERLYGGRMGNDQVGDGCRYCGRGPVMLTGKDNYIEAGKALGIDLVGHPTFLLIPKVGAQVACWYWRTRGLDAWDDDNDVRAETRLVQGGTLGLAERQREFDRVLKILKTTEAT